jgi:hypothetical protein
VETFRSFAMVRRILGMYEDMARKGESGVCFLRIVLGQGGVRGFGHLEVRTPRLT